MFAASLDGQTCVSILRPQSYWYCWLSLYTEMDACTVTMCFVFKLTHWGRVTHICVGNLTIIGSDNGLSPGRRQAIIRINAEILLIGPWGTNFSEMLIGIHTFSFKKIHLKMSSAKWRPFCLGLNVLSRQNTPSSKSAAGHSHCGNDMMAMMGLRTTNVPPWMMGNLKGK